MAGKEEAQRALYLEYRTKWYMLCLRYGKNRFEADDMLQEGLIQIFKDLHQFDVNRGSFATWSSRVLSNAALRYLKKQNWHNSIANIEEVYDHAVSEEDAYDKLAAKELTAFVQQLPMGYRLVFNMYVMEGYSHKEIAEQLEISVGTSKSQLSKAKKMLRNKLENVLTEYSKK